MTDNLAIWNALGKTDPGATKAFSRAGGFKGTSVKPMWVLKRLTEQFGPAGEGWGVNKPEFELVHSQEGEVLVFCTVSAWHGKPSNVLWGVGGDKAVTKRNDGKVFHDDEAFKKAFTDAVGNAFKSLGVAADIHMGLFDDDKYVSAMEREFSGPPAKITDAQASELSAELLARGIAPHVLFGVAKANLSIDVTKITDLPASAFDDAIGWVRLQKKAA